MVVLNEIYLIILAGLSIIFGILFGHFIFWLKNHYKKSKTDNEENFLPKKNDIKNINYQKQLLELEAEGRVSDQYGFKKNRHMLEDEIKLYQFEKDLVTRAIENILMASKNKKIDDLERDRLLIKYKEQLGSLNQNMEKIQSQLDIKNLMNFRDDLLNILENKIGQIDEKIVAIQDKYKNFMETGLENKSYRLTSINNKSDSNNQGKNNLKNSLNKFFNNNKHSKSRDTEIVDYKVDYSIDGVIDDEKKIQDIRYKVIDALDSLEKIKPLEDSIKDKIETINNDEKREQIEKEEIKLSKQDAKNDYKEDIKIINISKRETKEDEKIVDENNQRNSEISLNKSNTSTNLNENKFPLGSFFSRQSNGIKVDEKIEDQKILKKDRQQNRNPLGNIFKNTE